jgi:hypothetical protein
MLPGLVEDQSHIVTLFDVIGEDELVLSWSACLRAKHDIALLASLLDEVLVGRNILLNQSFNVVGILLIFFFLLSTMCFFRRPSCTGEEGGGSKDVFCGLPSGPR